MKKLIALVAALAFSAPAFANETTAQCEAYIAEYGGDASGCPCLGEMAAADADLAAKIAAIATPADVEAADQSVKDAIGACFPEA